MCYTRAAALLQGCGAPPQRRDEVGRADGQIWLFTGTVRPPRRTDRNSDREDAKFVFDERARLSTRGTRENPSHCTVQRCFTFTMVAEMFPVSLRAYLLPYQPQMTRGRTNTGPIFLSQLRHSTRIYNVLPEQHVQHRRLLLVPVAGATKPRRHGRAETGSENGSCGVDEAPPPRPFQVFI